MVCKCLHTCGVYKHESRTDSAFEELTIKQEVKDRSVQPGSAPLRCCLWPGKMCQAPSEKCRIPRPKSYMVRLTSLNLSPHCVLSATFVLISHSVSGRPWGRSPWSHSLSLRRLPVPGLLISPSSSGPSSPQLSGTCPPLISPPIVWKNGSFLHVLWISFQPFIEWIRFICICTLICQQGGDCLLANFLSNDTGKIFKPQLQLILSFIVYYNFRLKLHHACRVVSCFNLFLCCLSLAKVVILFIVFCAIEQEKSNKANQLKRR